MPAKSFQLNSHVVLGRPSVDSQRVLGGSGDLVNLLSNGPYRAYYGLLWWLIGGYQLDLLSQLIIQVGGLIHLLLRAQNTTKIRILLYKPWLLESSLCHGGSTSVQVLFNGTEGGTDFENSEVASPVCWALELECRILMVSVAFRTPSDGRPGRFQLRLNQPYKSTLGVFNLHHRREDGSPEWGILRFVHHSMGYMNSEHAFQQLRRCRNPLQGNHNSLQRIVGIPIFWIRSGLGLGFGYRGRSMSLCSGRTGMLMVAAGPQEFAILCSYTYSEIIIAI